MQAPIRLTANRAFTLWTTPESLAAGPRAIAPAVRPLLKLPGAGFTTWIASLPPPPMQALGHQFTLWTQPSKVEKVTMSNAAKGAAVTKPVPVRPAPEPVTTPSWLPLAACGAVTAILGLMWNGAANDRDQFSQDKKDLSAKLEQQVGMTTAKERALTEKDVEVAMKTKAAEAAAFEKIAGAENKLMLASNTITEMKGQVKLAQDATTKVERELLNFRANLESNSKAVQDEATKAEEALNQLKRKAAQEVAEIQRKLDVAEGDKSAAIRDAAAAAAERDQLRTELEKLRKLTESTGPKP